MFDPENSGADDTRGLGYGIAPIGHKVSVVTPIDSSSGL